jgi:hypothetical protein
MLVLRTLGLVLAATLLVACVPGMARVTGSGRTVTKDYDFSDFTRIEAGSAFEVDVRQSDSTSVQVTVDDNLEQYLDVTQNGDTLRLQLKPSVRFGFSRATLRAKVSMPSLDGLDISGAARATVTGFNSQQPLDVQVSGASTLRGDITSGNARFDVSGASTVTLDGTAGDIDVEASGASTANLQDLAAANGRVSASGASRAVVNVSGTLDAEASGASSIRYMGNPAHVREDASGASSVGPR